MTDVLTAFQYITSLYQAHARGEIKILKIVWNVDDDKLIADISFTPAKPIEHINLNFIAVKSNTSFEEVIENHGMVGPRGTKRPKV